jgi:hypothetical protein
MVLLSLHVRRPRGISFIKHNKQRAENICEPCLLSRGCLLWSRSLETCLATKVLVCLLLRCKEACGGHKAGVIRPHFFKHHAGARAECDS